MLCSLECISGCLWHCRERKKKKSGVINGLCFWKMHIQANFLQKRAFHFLQKVALSSSENGSSSTVFSNTWEKPPKYTLYSSRCLLCCWVDSLYYQLYLFYDQCILIQWPMVSFQFVTGKKNLISSWVHVGVRWRLSSVPAGKHLCCAFFLFSMRFNSSCHPKSCITATA